MIGGPSLERGPKLPQGARIRHIDDRSALIVGCWAPACSQLSLQLFADCRRSNQVHYVKRHRCVTFDLLQRFTERTIQQERCGTVPLAPVLGAERFEQHLQHERHVRPRLAGGLRSSADTLDIQERQRIVRLVVSDILVGDETIVIRHSIPLSSMAPSGDGGVQSKSAAPPAPGGRSYLLRSGSTLAPPDNLLLDDLDKKLTRRGHRFCRYADDCNIYVRSIRAGERVMASVSRFLTTKLRLKVNEAKSAVARPEERKFLGFSMSNDGSERRIAPRALDTFKERIREMTSRTRGLSLAQIIEELTPYLVGWSGYFGFCQTPRVLTNLEAWIRRRLRS
jgi:hypothetical protein